MMSSIAREWRLSKTRLNGKIEMKTLFMVEMAFEVECLPSRRRGILI